MLEAEVATYLDTQGVVTYDASGTTGDTFINVLPSTPDDAVGIYSEGGPDPSPHFIEDRKDIQIIVRGTEDPRPAYSTAEDIYSALNGLTHYTFSDNTELIMCKAIQAGPIHIGMDDNQRHRYSLNFRLEIENATDHRSAK